MKKNSKYAKLLLSALVALLIFGVQVMPAKAADSGNATVVPYVVNVCPVWGANHQPNTKSFVKFAFSVDGTIYRATQNDCLCGAEVIFDDESSTTYNHYWTDYTMYSRGVIGINYVQYMVPTSYTTIGKTSTPPYWIGI